MLFAAGGENVYSSEVEAVLSAHPQVQQAAVFGVPNTVMGEMVHAAIVLHPSAVPITSQQLIKWCHESLASYKCPTTVHLMPELPLTGSGKVLKTALKAALAAGGPRRALEAPKHAALKPQHAANAVITNDSTPAQASAAMLAVGSDASATDGKRTASGPAVKDPSAAASTAASAPAAPSAAAPAAAGGMEPGVPATDQLEALVLKFANKEGLPVQADLQLDAAKCYLLVVPDWPSFTQQVGFAILTLAWCISCVCLFFNGE